MIDAINSTECLSIATQYARIPASRNSPINIEIEVVHVDSNGAVRLIRRQAAETTVLQEAVWVEQDVLFSPGWGILVHYEQIKRRYEKA